MYLPVYLYNNTCWVLCCAPCVLSLCISCWLIFACIMRRKHVLCFITPDANGSIGQFSTRPYVRPRLLMVPGSHHTYMLSFHNTKMGCLRFTKFCWVGKHKNITSYWWNGYSIYKGDWDGFWQFRGQRRPIGIFHGGTFLTAFKMRSICAFCF